METTKKTIIFENETIEKVEKMAKEGERDFSGQIRFIIKEYIRLMDKSVTQPSIPGAGS